MWRLQPSPGNESFAMACFHSYIARWRLQIAGCDLQRHISTAGREFTGLLLWDVASD